MLPCLSLLTVPLAVLPLPAPPVHQLRHLRFLEPELRVGAAPVLQEGPCVQEEVFAGRLRAADLKVLGGATPGGRLEVVPFSTQQGDLEF